MGSRTETSSRADDPVGRAELAEFMTRAGEDLVALAYVMTGSQDEAQDVVHEVFVRLLRADVTGVDNLWSYARRAVTNECASWGGESREGRAALRR